MGELGQSEALDPLTAANQKQAGPDRAGPICRQMCIKQKIVKLRLGSGTQALSGSLRLSDSGSVTQAQ